MPPKSQAQAAFMRAVASGTARKRGRSLPSAKVAAEFVKGHLTRNLPKKAKKK